MTFFIATFIVLVYALGFSYIAAGLGVLALFSVAYASRLADETAARDRAERLYEQVKLLNEHKDRGKS